MTSSSPTRSAPCRRRTCSLSSTSGSLRRPRGAARFRHAGTPNRTTQRSGRRRSSGWPHQTKSRRARAESCRSKPVELLSPLVFARLAPHCTQSKVGVRRALLRPSTRAEPRASGQVKSTRAEPHVAALRAATRSSRRCVCPYPSGESTVADRAQPLPPVLSAKASGYALPLSIKASASAGQRSREPPFLGSLAPLLSHVTLVRCDSDCRCGVAGGTVRDVLWKRSAIGLLPPTHDTV